MKKLFCIFLLLALNLPVTFAQGHFSNHQGHFNNHERPNVNPLLVGGIVTATVGVVGLGLGGMIYALSATSEGRNNTALPVMAVGGALIVGGVIMICVGASQMNGKRFSLVAPKPNQFGVAYNLSKR